jgi:hypothetical protein
VLGRLDVRPGLSNRRFSVVKNWRLKVSHA